MMYNNNKHFIIREDVFLLYDMIYNDNIYFSLYKKTYNDNKYFLIHESVFLLYDMIYNDNIYFSLYKKIIMKQTFSLYMKVYFCYTRRCI